MKSDQNDRPPEAPAAKPAVAASARAVESHSHAADPLEHVAAAVRQRGLATPALMLLTIARPLGFVGAQCLSMVQPLIPQQEWQARIGRTASALEDEALWTRLENLLQ
jgi:hypothetical protein